MSSRTSPRSRPGLDGAHLGDLVSAYVDRDLPADQLLACDRHLAVCAGCRGAAQEERRLLQSLRSTLTPPPSRSLESLLLGLAAQAAQPAPTCAAPRPVAVISRTAPAMHRSPVRAALLASLAAGASAAAAWSLGVVGVGVTAAPSPPPPGRPAAATGADLQAAHGSLRMLPGMAPVAFTGAQVVSHTLPAAAATSQSGSRSASPGAPDGPAGPAASTASTASTWPTGHSGPGMRWAQSTHD